MRAFKLKIIGKDYDIQVEKLDSRQFRVDVNGKSYEAQIEDVCKESFLLAVDGSLYTVEPGEEKETGMMDILVNNRKRNIESKDLLASKVVEQPRKTQDLASDTLQIAGKTQVASKAPATANGIIAPMPGKVVAVMVNCGDEVKVGDVVVILEAMKMENEIVSNMDGKISEVHVKEGDSVDADDILVIVG